MREETDFAAICQNSDADLYDLLLSLLTCNDVINRCTNPDKSDFSALSVMVLIPVFNEMYRRKAMSGNQPKIV